jgi:hypothetical protein
MRPVQRLLVSCDPLGPLCTGSADFTRGIENAGAEKFSNELQFVSRQALYEAAGPRFMRTIGTRNQSGYQSASHGRSPVGEKSYSLSAGIMSKIATPRKGHRTGERAVLVTAKPDLAV